jgi:hypothetical protein
MGSILDGVCRAPSLASKQPAERHGYLPMLIPLRARGNRSRKPQDLAAHLDKLRSAIAGAIFYRLAGSKRHDFDHAP